MRPKTSWLPTVTRAGPAIFSERGRRRIHDGPVLRKTIENSVEAKATIEHRPDSTSVAAVFPSDAEQATLATAVGVRAVRIDLAYAASSEARRVPGRR